MKIKKLLEDKFDELEKVKEHRGHLIPWEEGYLRTHGNK